MLYAMLYGSVPFKANTMDELRELILEGSYPKKGTVSLAARSLIAQLLEVSPNKRINIGKIFKHPWFSKYEEGLSLVNEDERKIIEKDFFRVHNSDKEESIFTECEIDASLMDSGRNVSSKSIILAPFNSTMDDKSKCVIDGETVDHNRVIFADKVREINRQYERNNNCELDNGIYNKNVIKCASSTNTKLDPFANSPSESPRYKDDSTNKNLKNCVPTFTTPIPLSLNEEVCKKVESFGFPREYIEHCLTHNETNHATATYFLLLDEKNAH